jgi:hypothetical protein
MRRHGFSIEGMTGLMKRVYINVNTALAIRDSRNEKRRKFRNQKLKGL